MRFTIITPSFNQGAFLERTLESVFAQDWEDLEYFVVDGGSTDDSVEIIERHASRLAWWVSEPDRGQTHALNKGLARATGDIVAFVNSDDYFLPGAFATAASVFERDPALWVVGASRFEDSDDPAGNHVWRPEPPPRSRPAWLLAPWGVPQPSSFWRREVFERYGPFREDFNYAFDTEHALRLALAGELPALIDDELAVRYLHGEAKSADSEPFERERERLVALFRPQLSLRERSELRVRQTLRRLSSAARR